MSISKKIRFLLLKKHNFTCQYCGKKAPHTELEIDHINPRSNGGKDHIDNLTVSCFDCNRGKADVVIDETLIIKKEKEVKSPEEIFEKLENMNDYKREIIIALLKELINKRGKYFYSFYEYEPVIVFMGYFSENYEVRCFKN